LKRRNAMSFDIYGENLRLNHCEVHPWVHESYPCPACFADADNRKRQEEEAEISRRAEEDEYYAAMAQAMVEELQGVNGEGI
jgi:hypothetical protein